MRTIDHFPVLIVVTTLLGAYLSPVVAWFRRKLVPYVMAGVGLLALYQAVSMMSRVTADGDIAYSLGNWPPPWGIELLVTPAAALVAVTIAAIASLVGLYSSATLDHEVGVRGHGWYAAAFLLAQAGMLGLAVTNDLFNVFVMMEITTLGAVGLVVAKNTWGAAEAGLRYLLLGSLASTIILFGIGMLYMVTGNLNMTYIIRELPAAAAAYPLLVKTSLVMLLLGLCLKAALFPLHIWLPEAHGNAPSPSSAMLSGLVVEIYAFTALRVLYVLYGPILATTAPIRATIVLLAAGAILAGSAFAIVQVDIKRMLAYSTVAQVGYIFLGAGLGTPAGIIAAFYQVVGHAITKVCLFLSAGLIIEKTGRRKVAEMGGMGRVMPVATIAFTICGLSMIGIPLLSGFVVKWYLIQAGLEARQTAIVALVVASGLLNAVYYLPIIWRFYFVSPAKPLPDHRPVIDPAAWPQPTAWQRFFMRLEAPWQALLPIVVLAASCVVLGIWTGPLVGYLSTVATAWLGVPLP